MALPNVSSRGQFASVEEYVEFVGGQRPIKKVLIANNGIAAVKAIRSIRRWAFEMFQDERAVSFVAMATPDDMRANAEYIRMADEVVDVPGGSNNNNYANVMLIVEIAERWQVDAVWAGWGHASENPKLPDSLAKTERRVVFIGPPGAPMRALGDKIGSTIIAQSAGVPVIAWNGDGITCDYKTGGLSDEVYQRANVTTAEQALQAAAAIGYPVMVKASEGGGGKGIRKVLDADTMPALFRQVQGEVPGSPIFVMKLAPASRHLEVQLLADAHGQAIALNGRDCSVQRRHQKIIEEGPPVAAPPQVWKQMERAAVTLAKEVGYINAGTVEYLFTAGGGGGEEEAAFFFLELNPRLQVEHPVTEMITHVNLPAAQLQVAMGVPLHRIPDIRRLYGLDALGDSRIDFDTAERIPPDGHCIAVRVTAENPDLGFKPTAGTIQELNFRSTPNVWGYFSVDSSGLVHEFADSQFGHLFAKGENREAARKAMVLALKELSIRGDIRTTVEYISVLMATKDYVRNHLDTTWLDKRIADPLEKQNRAGRPEPTVVVTIGGIIAAYRRATAKATAFVELLAKGQFPSDRDFLIEQPVDLIYEDVKYQLTAMQTAPGSFLLACNGSHIEATIRSLADGGYLVLMGGKSHVAYMKEEAGGLRMVLNGQTCMFTKEYDPTRLTTDVAGKLARCLVPDGAHLQKGQPFAEVEVMKMFMNVCVGEAGVIRWRLSEGAALAPGALMAELELDDPNCVTKATVYSGSLPQPETKGPVASKPHHSLRAALKKLELVMNGFCIAREEYDKALEEISEAVTDPLLPVYEFQEALAPIGGRIDAGLTAQLQELAEGYRQKVEGRLPTHLYVEDFPALQILQLINDFALALPERERAAFMTVTEAMRTVTEHYANGIPGRTVVALLGVVRQYLNVERNFSGYQYQDVVQRLRRAHSGELHLVYDHCRSHAALTRKNALLLTLLEHISVAASKARDQELGSLSLVPTPLSYTGSETSSITSPMSDPLTPKRDAASMLMPAGGLKRSLVEGTDINVFLPVLTELSNLTDTIYAIVANAARSILIEQTIPTVEQRRQKLKAALVEVMNTPNPSERAARIEEFLEENVRVGDLLLYFLRKSDKEAQAALMELYVRKIYKMHRIKSVDAFTSLDGNGADDGVTWATWQFTAEAAEALPAGVSNVSSFLDLTQLVRARSSGNSSGNESDDGGNASSGSVDGLGGGGYKIPAGVWRVGVFARFEKFETVRQHFPALLDRFPKSGLGGGLVPKSSLLGGPVNALHVLVLRDHADDADATAQRLTSFLREHLEGLKAALVRRVTFMVWHKETKGGEQGGGGGGGAVFQAPAIYTFRAKNDFAEDSLFRHIEPSHAFHLDLVRLSSFHIQLADTHQTESSFVHLYEAVPKKSVAQLAGLKPPYSKRFFARLVSTTITDHIPSELERLMVESFNALYLAIGKEEEAAIKAGGKPIPPNNNHIFFNFLAANTVVEPTLVAELLRTLMGRYQDKLLRLGVVNVELKLVCRLRDDTAPVALRLLASNPTGYVLRIDSYVEGREGPRTIYRSIGTDGRKPGELEGLDVTSPYAVTRPFEKQRQTALAASDTLYCYDFLELLERAVQMKWEEYAKLRPRSDILRPRAVLHATELVVAKKGTALSVLEEGAGEEWSAADEEQGLLDLVEVTRAPGLNDVGMVAWKATVFTPEYPEGRQMVLIANDITVQAGSFGTREDTVFSLASRYAREQRLPRIYLAANSGARIGMADSVKARFKVAWQKEEDPNQGFKYLYLTKEDYQELKGAVRAELVVEGNGEERYAIRDIIGQAGEKDLGVENLKGSGTIAGETSVAYHDVFTLTLVVGRTVGIGAYLVRLGQRTIQKTTNAPIILTGFQALNKLMGKAIYTSNDQLGGQMIMFPNGVSHLLAENHLEGVLAVLTWLSYVPSVRGGFLPIQDITGVDVVERPVAFTPQKGIAYDPRHLVAGTTNELDGTWISGFFDKGSFTETLAGWAKTVVVGRARLGGIPCGVIITETRTAEATTPADPADSSSQERNIQQAGGVWFPDSAYKTAQAIRDFAGEDLPLLIFANWRGFSGGQRDMFDEVLKFGSMIVDALVAFQQPLFVYIPPFAELRGGAWVVVDPTIHAEVMEMYAASEARGGVLEPNGAAEIKFREKDYVAAAHRLDAKLRTLDQELKAALETGADASEVARLKKEVKEREGALKGVYAQVAVQFADLHDTPGRMQAVGVIRRIVPWAEARSFFYWRLRRRLAEFHLRKEVVKGAGAGAGGSSSGLTAMQASAALRQWYCETPGKAPEGWEDDREVLSWMAEHRGIEERIQQAGRARVAQQVATLAGSNPQGALEGVLHALRSLPEGQDKQALLAALKAAI